MSSIDGARCMASVVAAATTSALPEKLSYELLLLPICFKFLLRQRIGDQREGGNGWRVRIVDETSQLSRHRLKSSVCSALGWTKCVPRGTSCLLATLECEIHLARIEDAWTIRCPLTQAIDQRIVGVNRLTNNVEQSERESPTKSALDAERTLHLKGRLSSVAARLFDMDVQYNAQQMGQGKRFFFPALLCVFDDEFQSATRLLPICCTIVGNKARSNCIGVLCASVGKRVLVQIQVQCLTTTIGQMPVGSPLAT